MLRSDSEGGDFWPAKGSPDRRLGRTENGDKEHRLISSRDLVIKRPQLWGRISQGTEVGISRRTALEHSRFEECLMPGDTASQGGRQEGSQHVPRPGHL